MTQEMLKIKKQYEDFNNPLSPYANDNSNNEQEQNLKISKKAMSFAKCSSDNCIYIYISNSVFYGFAKYTTKIAKYTTKIAKYTTQILKRRKNLNTRQIAKYTVGFAKYTTKP